MALRPVKLSRIGVAQENFAARHPDCGGHVPQEKLLEGAIHSKGQHCRKHGPTLWTAFSCAAFAMGSSLTATSSLPSLTACRHQAGQLVGLTF